MELYDPNYPSVHGSYKYFQMSKTVLYNLSRYLQYGDLLLSVDAEYIGRISSLCNKIFCQSKGINGIIKIQTSQNRSIGHIILAEDTAHHFIPIADNEFLIDKQIIYKREGRHYHGV